MSPFSALKNDGVPPCGGRDLEVCDYVARRGSGLAARAFARPRAGSNRPFFARIVLRHGRSRGRPVNEIGSRFSVVLLCATWSTLSAAKRTGRRKVSKFPIQIC